MKKTLITLLALAGVATATDYNWTGDANDGLWETGSNWDSGSFPNSTAGNHAIINHTNTGVDITTVTATAPAGRKPFNIAPTITLNANTSLILSAGGTQLDINAMTFNLNGNSSVTLTGSNAAGFEGATTINYGTFTADSHGLMDFASYKGALWTNAKTITLTGVLDFSGLTGSGTIELFKSKTSAGGGDLNFDYSNLQWASSNANIKTELIADGMNISIKYDVAAVPEPTTATLSLLALAGLAARRRRK